MEQTMQDKMKDKKLFYRTPKVEDGKATYEYNQILKGYVVRDRIDNKYIIMNARGKKCTKEKEGQRIEPINDFVDKEYKFVDSFKLVPFGKLTKKGVFVYEDQICEEIIHIDRKP
jgi:hypothetical protein